MWGVWILLCAAFFTELRAVESVEVRFGQELSISMKAKDNTLEFTSLDRSINCTVWPKNGRCNRGHVSGTWTKSFVIKSVHFDDQGTYIEKINRTKVISVTTVKVVASRDTQSCEIGQTLTISLDGLRQDEASLRFSNKEVVKRGSAVPEYSEQVTVTSSSIKMLILQVSDEGTYTLTDRKSREVKVITLQVRAPTETKSLMTGQTLIVSLGRLRQSEASLHFSNKDVNLMLVRRGSPDQNLPNYSGRIQVTSSSIQVLNIQVTDGGKYRLLDGKESEIKIVTLKVTDPCASKIENMDLPYGRQLNIYLLFQSESLGFTSVNKSQEQTIWSGSVRPKRGRVVGSGFDKHFIISSVNFEDQGDYTQRNSSSKVICVTKVKVHTSVFTEFCFDGETFTISLDGLSKDEVSLHFSSKHVNLMMVNRGSPVGEHMNRIQVTSSSIQVLEVTESDLGQYTLSDGKGREVKIITLELVKPVHLAYLGFLVVVVLLVGIPVYFKERIVIWQREAN